MKRTTLVSIILACLLAACDKSATTTPTPTPTPVNPYYFKFTINGKDYNYNTDFEQYMSMSVDRAGGYQQGAYDIYPSIGLAIQWPFDDTVSEADLLSLKGKTLYFDDSITRPEILFNEEMDQYAGWESLDTSDHNFYVKISDITYLKDDTTYFAPVKVYVVSGTCRAVMNEPYDSLTTVLSNGEFKFRISRRNNY